MAASEYLSTHAADTTKQPVRAAIYTDIAYILTVTLLIMPYLLLKNYLLCLVITLILAMMIIAIFNYYVSVAKGENFRRFTEMTGVCLGEALLSFVIGFIVANG
jgi:vacuolar iron transporter family protein